MLYDCESGSEEDWSQLQNTYCCDHVGLGCDQVKDHIPDFAKPEPHWLQIWLGDISITSKFTVSMALMMLLGCCCGLGCGNHAIKAIVPPKRHRTEAEIIKEMEKCCHRLDARSGEITVTLMWDTQDDLDLSLELPNNLGAINANNPECCGGMLDVDGNISVQRPNCKPIEHIYFPHFTMPDDQDINEFDRIDRDRNGYISKDDWVQAKRKRPQAPRVPPPAGKYTVRVTEHSRHDHEVAINFVVCVNILGRRELFHSRLVPGSTEVEVATFRYERPGPGSPARAKRNAMAGGMMGGGAQVETEADYMAMGRRTSAEL